MDFNNEFLSLSGHERAFRCIIKRVSIHDRGGDLEQWIDYHVFFGVRVCPSGNKDLPANEEVAGVKVNKMWSRGPAARDACCRANSRAHNHCLLVNGSGILRERLLFAHGALSNETWGLGSECIKSPGLSHTRWDENDGGGPLAEENQQSIGSSLPP